MDEDFRGQNLRGRSFRGRDLRNADFSDADIRGTNFTRAILKGADFSHARAGLRPSLAMLLLSSSFLLSALSGIALQLAIRPVIAGIGTKFIFGATIFLLLAAFFTVTMKRGLVVGALVAVTIAIVIAVVAAGVGDGSGLLAETLEGAVAGVVTIIIVSFGVVAISVVGAVAITIAEVIAIAGVVIAALFGALLVAVIDILNKVTVVAIALAGTGILLGAYIAIRALAGDKTFAFIRPIVITIAATCGTSFRKADLTDAKFIQAMLKSTNFRGAILTRTRWYQAKKLDQASVGDSMLIKDSVRDLLITGNGCKKSYEGENLKGANLTGANLSEANLKESDISQATLEGANLEEANLTQAQAVGTNFTKAYLTGACLEAWNIDSTTKLQQVNCRYVYLLEHPNSITGDRERRPHDPDGVFAPGDFEKLYKKIMNTVQILLRNGINKEAFTIALEKLIEENPEITPDSIQAIEKKGNDVLLTLEVPEETDKGKVQRDFEQAYEARLEAQKQAALLEAEIRHNKDIKEIAIAALVSNQSSSSIFNLTNAVTAESKAMSDSIDKSRNLSISDMQGDVTGNIVLGDNTNISGAVTKIINQLPDSPEPDKPSVKELLTQLQAAIEAETDLDEEDRAEALEQVKALAEAGKNPQEGAMQKAAKTAMKILKGTVISLPSAATLVEACNKLLPAIATLLGLG